jgi:hypothetical protein
MVSLFQPVHTLNEHEYRVASLFLLRRHPGFYNERIFKTRFVFLIPAIKFPAAKPLGLFIFIIKLSWTKPNVSSRTAFAKTRKFIAQFVVCFGEFVRPYSP